MTDTDTCVLIATKDGAATIAEAVTAAATQARVLVVSDGSTDETAAVARAAGAEVLALETNIGKPAALRRLFEHFAVDRHHRYVVIVDDDTVLSPHFISRCRAHFERDEDVVVTCGETRSDWRHEQRWNGWVGARALAYWRYGLLVKRGQAALRAVTVIPGANSMFRTDVMADLLVDDVRYVVDDTQWLLEIQTRRLGRVAYAPDALAHVQDPLTPGEWYRQTVRWMWGTFQGVRGHRVGRTWSWFSVTYSLQLLDWLLYVLLWPLVLGTIVTRAAMDSPERLGLVLAIYLAGYVAWAIIGAIALRRWRLIPLFPYLIAMDWMQRAVTIHGAIRALRQPEAECRWISPPRFATTGTPS